MRNCSAEVVRMARLRHRRSFLWYVTWSVAVGGFLVLSLACLGAAYQVLASLLDQRANPPPGRLVDVGGYRMHIYCVGTGSPAVVLESGLSDSWLSWHKVQPKVAQFTRVCSYDRAGLGWSDSSPKPRTSKVFAEELRSLLQRAKVIPPYVLVGHSMGGYDVRMFTSLYASEVIGMVLVDATHPDVFDRLPKLKQGTEDWCRSLQRKEYEMFFGLARLQHSCGNTHPDFTAMHRAVECRESYVRETRAECISIVGESAAQVRATGPLGKIPLIVITEDPNRNSKEFLPAFERGQAELARLSTNSQRIIATGSGHQIQLERPDLVIQAVRDIIARARSLQ